MRRFGPQLLEERRVHVPVREATVGAVLVVDRREDVSVRPHLAQLQEHPVGAAQAHEKVVNEGHSAESPAAERLPTTRRRVYGRKEPVYAPPDADRPVRQRSGPLGPLARPPGGDPGSVSRRRGCAIRRRGGRLCRRPDRGTGGLGVRIGCAGHGRSTRCPRTAWSSSTGCTPSWSSCARRAWRRCGNIPLPDAVIVDGDHNYYTVSEELRLIGERAPGASPAAAAVP